MPIPLRIDRRIGLALERHLFMRPEPEQAVLSEAVEILSGDIRNMGRISALEVLWAIGRMMNERYLGRSAG